MVQQVTITAESPVSLKPLVEGAIRGEMELLLAGINRTRERLAAFERQFAMSSAEFEQRFDRIKIKETVEFIDWWCESELLKLLESRYKTLETAEIR